MTADEKPLAELVQDLPLELQSQVRTYVTQLLRHHDRQARRPPRHGAASCRGARPRHAPDHAGEGSITPLCAAVLCGSRAAESEDL